MGKKSWVSIYILCLFFFQHAEIQAQKITKNIIVNWTDNVIYTLFEDETMEFLHFNRATYSQEFPTLPIFQEQIPISQFYLEYDVTISDIESESFDAHNSSLIPQNFHSKEIVVDATSAYEKDKAYLVYQFIPIIETGDGQYRRITSLSITLAGKKPVNSKSTKTYAQQSVLSNGKWYSFQLAQTGIYKVTYEDLTALGMTTPIVSSYLALFGNGGGMLPEKNNAPRIDDLRELSISISDGNDGSFDEGDFFLFYGESPHTWIYDSVSGHFSHTTNIYSDSTHYFITCSPNIGEKKRVLEANNNTLSANKTVNEYTHYDFLEDDRVNLVESGKEWFGDLFDITTSRTYQFDVRDHIQGPGQITIAGANASTAHSYFTVRVNNNDLGIFELPDLMDNQASARMGSQSFAFTPQSGNLSITLEYNKPTTSSSAYLDWIEIEVPRRLTMHSAQFPFCNPSTVGTGNITQFNIGNANGSTKVWDVTDPSQISQFTLHNDGSNYSFKTQTDILRKFYAFSNSDFLRISPIGIVENQNLHATNDVDMVIVTHPKFLSEANRLAAFRQSNNGLKVKVVTTQQVYNEFSSGSQDPMAIRDYLKMIYDRTDKQNPQYLLLIGRPSYDFRGRVNNTELYVPNYQFSSNGTVNELYSYSNDDVFGLLDDYEGGSLSGMFDVAVGRFPCSTVAQAKAAVDKSITYTEKRILVTENSSQISNFGDWRNIMAFCADDEDHSYYMANADTFSNIIERQNANINLDKIYLDAFQQISNAGGQRYPEVNTAINNRMNRGALFFTYVGHSGKDGWANERILENSDINKWINKYNLPMMLTLSCTFGRYDRPSLSPAELALFNSNGGVSAILTANREAWSTNNEHFGKKLFSNFFDNSRGRYPTVGELGITGKNLNNGNANERLRMFVLMGDPSMPLAIPTYRIITDSINHQPVTSLSDTIRALSKMTVSGHIEDANGEPIPMNGSIFPSVYDKKIMTSTLSNDPGSPKLDFTIQKNILFKGNCSVNNGKFNFSFYVPKDIDYTYGNGKISYYANSSNQDATGAFTDFIIGGTDTNSLNDKEGPVIELFMNDENFVNGGIVGPSPVLVAKIKDNYGINTTGNGIGHDLTAIFDDATESQIVLNDYYQTEKDSFNSGIIRYNLSDLAVGKHKVMVRAWDINNNHSESELTFEVLSDEKLTLSHVLNYPNPFTTHTDFYFEQNQNGGLFDIQVQIYTISGKLVKTIQESQFIEGNRSNAISWDGRDDYGDKIGKGVYMYKIRVRDQNDQTAEAIEKLVIL